MFSRSLIALVLVMGLGVEARADPKVDWSQYIEKPGDRVVNKPAAESPPAAVAAKPAKSSTKKAKPAAKKAAKRPPAHKH